MIVSKDEGHLLRNCLPKLSFCDQLIVVNLKSKDDTIMVAKENGAEVWDHNPVPIVEIIHNWIQKKVQYDWILISDPDEVLTIELQKEIISFFEKIPENVGAIRVPLVFYFKNRALKGTAWGGGQTRIFLVNRNRFHFTPDVHSSRRLNVGYKEYLIPFSGKNVLNHYWMLSYKQLFEKHIRYLKKEGEARYNAEKRTSWKGIVSEPLKSFHYSFFSKKGYLDGGVGLFLSLFWAWYQTLALISLLMFQIKQKRSHF